MPDAGRQIWEIRIPRDVELTLLKNKMSKNKTKTLKKELRELENQRKRYEKEMNKKYNEKMIFGQITLKYSLGLSSFLSKPRTQAYITYLESPFWLNVDMWTEEFSSLRNLS